MTLADCIYCAGQSGDRHMTLEHIWPQGLGGAYAPEIFQTRQVCRSCNNAMGQWVDGLFIKSWFVGMDRVLSAHSHLDPTRPESAPLLYWGFDEGMPLAEGYVCERWTGLANETIYHVHLADKDRWWAHAGGDVIRRKGRDPGRVYFFLGSPTAYWVRTLVLSLSERFPRARRRCMNPIVGSTDDLPFLRLNAPIETPEEAAEIAWLQAHAGSDRPTKMNCSGFFGGSNF
jgi:hypothetical protein